MRVREVEGTASLVSRLSKMKKLHVFLAVGLGTLLSPPVQAGGPNKLVSASQRGDGFARVVKVGNKDVVEKLEMPTATARMMCKTSGFRVRRVGPKKYKPVSTDVTYSWNMADSEGPSASTLGAVCRSGHAVANIPVQVQGECEQVKITFGVKGVDGTRTMHVPFALDCRGYEDTSREALIMLEHPETKDNLALPAGKLWYAESLGYRRRHVLGEIPKTGSSTRKKMHMGQKGSMRGSVVAPATMVKMHQQGWSISPKEVGFVEKNAGAGRTALHSFYHSGRQDYALAAGTGPVEVLISQGYEHRRVEGFIDPPK